MSTPAQLKTRGYLLLASFFAVLIAIFLPLVPAAHGDKKVNGLDYLDNFFNELSKGSAYYIPDQVKAAEKYKGQEFTTTLKMKSPEAAAITAKLFATNNIEATADGGSDLILTTRYWIRTPMNGYAAWWGGVFLGDFHRNVLGVIKNRAEAAA